MRASASTLRRDPTMRLWAMLIGMVALVLLDLLLLGIVFCLFSILLGP